MKVRADNLTMSGLWRVLGALNTVYDGNVQFKREPMWARGWINFTLRVRSSHGPGHSRTMQNRRSVAACWHVHRDFMYILFTLYPETTLVSAMATYKGAADFRAMHRFTGEQNRGSMARPLRARDACDCHEDEADRGTLVLGMLVEMQTGRVA